MKKKVKLPCEVIILLPTFISNREIIAIALPMVKITNFVDRPAPVDGLGVTTIYRGRPIYEVSSFSHGKRYRNDLSVAGNMLGHKNHLSLGVAMYV